MDCIVIAEQTERQKAARGKDLAKTITGAETYQIMLFKCRKTNETIQKVKYEQSSVHKIRNYISFYYHCYQRKTGITAEFHVQGNSERPMHTSQISEDTKN